MTTTINGMGQPQTHTYNSCVTQDDLGKYPFADPDNHCKYTVVSSTGSQMDANGTCAPGGEGTVTFNLQLQAVDSENVKGTGHLTMSGQGGSMDGNYSAKAKWVGPSCSAGAK
jgi:hypothetical protein